MNRAFIILNGALFIKISSLIAFIELTMNTLSTTEIIMTLFPKHQPPSMYYIYYIADIYTLFTSLYIFTNLTTYLIGEIVTIHDKDTLKIVLLTILSTSSILSSNYLSANNHVFKALVKTALFHKFLEYSFLKLKKILGR